MARTVATLPAGSRVSDFITMGVLAERIPVRLVHDVLKREKRASERHRLLPAHVVVYYVIALGIFMNVSYGEVLRCLVEGLAWLGWPVKRLRRMGRSGISQARTRLGFEPMKRLYEELVNPIGTEETRGAYYRRWRLVSLDGSTLDVPDEAANEEAFGRPGVSRGKSGFPQLRYVSLVESGTHVLFAAAEGRYLESEIALARRILPRLQEGMLCLADRNFFSHDLWREAAGTGADLLWRMRMDCSVPCLQPLEDGSYLSKVYPSRKDRRHDRNGTPVRVIEYAIDGAEGAEPFYRLLTTILDHEKAPALDLAILYHERWEIETAFDEFKTHMRGPRAVLRSKTPDLVRQEFYGLLLAHYAVRGLMHEAALKADVDPDEISFTHSLRLIRRKIQSTAPFPPSPNSGTS